MTTKAPSKVSEHSERNERPTGRIKTAKNGQVFNPVPDVKSIDDVINVLRGERMEALTKMNKAQKSNRAEKSSLAYCLQAGQITRTIEMLMQLV